MKTILKSITAFFIYSIILGGIYPLFTTLLGQILFSSQASGSLITNNNKVVGSELIGQNFSSEKYLWGRPSATTPTTYNAGSSSGSNLALTNPSLRKNMEDQIAKISPYTNEKIPVDLVTASGSGLDPHISVRSALIQVSRIAKARGISEEQVKKSIAKNTENRTFGLLGEPRVNILMTNITLDTL